jgi:hypothetical protein
MAVEDIEPCAIAEAEDIDEIIGLFARQFDDRALAERRLDAEAVTREIEP